MFFDPDRIAAIREMICSDTVEQRKTALAKLEPMQQGDFEALYEAMEGKPVTIRFLDPPLHEFVPTEEKDIEALAVTQGKDCCRNQGNYRWPPRVQPHDGPIADAVWLSLILKSLRCRLKLLSRLQSM